jgi:O-antigen/teichoic acid export membrane protein
MITHVLKAGKKWGGKIAFSVADQAILSGSNFALNILLARWLSPAEYGVFALAFTVFTFVFGFHNALILEPMSVLGSTRFSERFPQYLGNLIWLHIALTGGIAVLIAFAASICQDQTFSNALWAIALAIPFILLFWLFRQAYYLQSKPTWSVLSSLIYAAVLFSGLIILSQRQWLSGFSAFLVMGMAGAIASILGWFLLEIRLNRVLPISSHSELAQIGYQHWGYGKWVVGSNLLFWLSNGIFLPLAGAFAGLEQVGALRALQNLTLPMDQMLTVMSMLLLPWASKQRQRHGTKRLEKVTWAIALIFTAVSGIYILSILFAGQEIITFLYGQKQYTSYLWLIPFLAGTFALSAVSQGLAIGLRAAERPNDMFKIRCWGTLVTLTCGVYFASAWGLYGIAIAMVLNGLTGTLAAVKYVWQTFRGKTK